MNLKNGKSSISVGVSILIFGKENHVVKIESSDAVYDEEKTASPDIYVIKFCNFVLTYREWSGTTFSSPTRRKTNRPHGSRESTNERNWGTAELSISSQNQITFKNKSEVF